MCFCQEAEKFVDDKLSNWYIRRNRARFQSGEASRDKIAAFQTLFTVLTTLTKLLAPVMPFLTETMYQNLEAWQPGRPVSVHLCEFPEVEAWLIDERLTADMDRLLDLVSLGLAARNEAKIRVRQPLAELKVQPGQEADRRAVERFADQLIEEINVKKVTLHDSSPGPLLRPEYKPNMKTLGPKFGPRLKDVDAAGSQASSFLEASLQLGPLGRVQAAIRNAPPGELAAKRRTGQPFELAGFMLNQEDVLETLRAPDGWAGVADRDTQVVIDARVTPDLKREGMARDVIRQVQNLRKEANLEMEDRITLYLHTEAPELRQAVDAHRGYIASETLTVQWASASLDGSPTANVKIEGQPLTIQLRVAEQDR
jgi:isoleucyl-tRNA synthetase